MEATKYIWFNGKLVPWSDAKIHVLTHSLHYGTGAFEGIRMYETAKGPAIFHLRKHMERLEFSGAGLDMKLPYSVDQLCAAAVELVKTNELKSCYIRPIIYYGFGEVRVLPTNCPIEIAMAAWPWGAYLGDEPARVIIVKTQRIHPQTTVPGAKLTGNYINSMLSVREAVQKGYTEGMQLDAEGNIAEGSGENFFMVSSGGGSASGGNKPIISTPALGSILPGITRWSVLTLAKDLGYTVEERAITPAEAFAADECFFTGTAAEVTPIASIDDKPMKSPFGPVTKQISEEFKKITRGENPKYLGWLTFVK